MRSMLLATSTTVIPHEHFANKGIVSDSPEDSASVTKTCRCQHHTIFGIAPRCMTSFGTDTVGHAIWAMRLSSFPVRISKVGAWPVKRIFRAVR